MTTCRPLEMLLVVNTRSTRPVRAQVQIARWASYERYKIVLYVAANDLRDQRMWSGRAVALKELHRLRRLVIRCTPTQSSI